MKKLVIAGMLIASLTALVACEDASVEAAQEQRMTLVAPLIGTPLMLTFWFLAEYCRRKGAKGGEDD